MTAQRPTARERFLQELATNPRLKEAPNTGQGFVFLGYKPAEKENPNKTPKAAPASRDH
jgi:hypothetical protein